MRTFVKTLKTAKFVVLARVARVSKHVVTVVCTKATMILHAGLSLRADFRDSRGLHRIHGMQQMRDSQSGLGCWQSPSLSWQPVAARLVARTQAARSWSRPPRS